MTFQRGDIISYEGNLAVVVDERRATFTKKGWNNELTVTSIDYHDLSNWKLVQKKPNDIRVGDQVVRPGHWPIYTVTAFKDKYACLVYDSDQSTCDILSEYLLVLIPIKRPIGKILKESLYRIRNKKYSIVETEEI